MYGARWFPEARLNFAENLLRGEDSRAAVIEANESGILSRVTMGELRALVAHAQRALISLGVRPGDCVASVLPNSCDALVMLLATSSIGAVWASCSPEFGPAGIIDRIGQVKPKALITVVSYRYNGNEFFIGEKIKEVVAGLPGLQHVVLMGTAKLGGDSRFREWDSFGQVDPALRPSYESLPFSHPLYLMFTSGTTGLPKAIVHTAGGVLLQHLKEHVLHGDVRPGDVLSWYSNTAWMMYHWMISALAADAAIVLYDGAAIPNAHGRTDTGILWHIAEEADVTHFGTSPRYLSSLMEQDYRPERHHNLSALRSVLSAGAPITPEQSEWVYSAIKKDMIFASISGGTEIMGCFVLGSPLHAVRRGEITCIALGMAVSVMDERNAPIFGSKGDLVCTEPFPSAPLTFWGENGDARYYSTYFDDRPDIWTHGDLAEITPFNTIIIYGRTDTVLKPGGVRIGTAEIYRALEGLAEITDAVAFGHKVGDDEQIVLCVVTSDDSNFDDTTKSMIRARIRAHASPRHVPHHIFRVSAVPYTLNGKRVEGAARSIFAGQPVQNLGSLLNPDVLSEFAVLSRNL